MRAKALRVDSVHFGHPGIDFCHPGHKGGLILDEGREGFLKPTIARAFCSGHVGLPQVESLEVFAIRQ